MRITSHSMGQISYPDLHFLKKRKRSSGYTEWSSSYRLVVFYPEGKKVEENCIEEDQSDVVQQMDGR